VERASAGQALDTLRAHLAAIVAAALDRVHASALVARALEHAIPILDSAASIHLLAAGKASHAMSRAFVSQRPERIRAGLVVGTRAQTGLPASLQFQRGAHPIPDADSVQAARRALALAGDASADVLVVLLSGGASAMMALPAEGLTMEDKQATTRVLLAHDATIHQINCVRKHLSAIKGGRLGAASAAPVITLAISDVVGDDLSVIGSGPTVPDPSTYEEALSIVERYGRETVPEAVVRHLQGGTRGERAETPKPADLLVDATLATVIGSSADAVTGARSAADELGYRVVIFDRPVTGEARSAATEYVAEIAALAASTAQPICVLSAGETTVRVTGQGRGGRNQEFALAAVAGLAALDRPAALASVGTDGVDGPTDAAGAIADSATLARARARGLDAMQYLGENDAWRFFDTLGDLVRTGETHTNVGDIQVTLVAPASVRVEAL
jgi:glycerate 2-kinase